MFYSGALFRNMDDVCRDIVFNKHEFTRSRHRTLIIGSSFKRLKPTRGSISSYARWYDTLKRKKSFQRLSQSIEGNPAQLPAELGSRQVMLPDEGVRGGQGRKKAHAFAALLHGLQRLQPLI